MTRARKHLVCLSETPYYHVSSRCVRRAYLCGVDVISGKSYEHRRGWVEDRIRVLSSLYNVEICAYAVMSNHYHLVVRLRPQQACDWSDDEVLSRWTALFRGPLLVQRYRSGESLNSAEHDTVQSIAAVYRSRLHSLSWFMKCLNEPIARKANVEDGCTGHFWEARFHSQPLVSEKALLSAMAYVDLNPVRADIASSPDVSEYTSVMARLQKAYLESTLTGAVSRLLTRGEIHHFNVRVRALLPFSCRNSTLDVPSDSLPMYEQDYLSLLDATGRVVRSGKRGRINSNIQPILQRLGLSVDEWLQAATEFDRHYYRGDLRLKRFA